MQTLALALRYEVGILMFSVVIVTVHLQVTTIEEQWTWIHHASIWGSQGGNTRTREHV